MSINSSYLNPDSSGAPYGANSSNGSADSYSFSGDYSSYDEPASPLSTTSAASATGASETGTGTETGTYGAYGAASATGASATGANTTGASASATSASSAAYNSTGAYSTDAYESTGSSNSTGAYESTGSSNSTKEDAVWRGQSSKEPAELKRPRVSTLIASLIMLAAAAILGALAMGVHFSWTAVGASTLGTIGLVLIVSAFFASRNKSHT